MKVRIGQGGGWRDLFYWGLRAFPAISAYVRASALMSRYAPSAWLPLTEKTSVRQTPVRVQGLVPWMMYIAVMPVVQLCPARVKGTGFNHTEKPGDL